MFIEAFITVTKIVSVYSLVVSVPLYIAVLMIIWKKRKTPPFNSSYFTLFIALGIVDIMYVF